MSEKGNRISHGFKRAQSFFEAQSALGWGVLLALLALVGVVYLLHGSQIIISGYTIQRTMAELEVLQEENTLLEAQIAAAEKVNALQDKAVHLGFIMAGPDDIEYLKVEVSPTSEQSDEQESTTSTAVPAKAANDWWLEILGGFSDWHQSTYPNDV